MLLHEAVREARKTAGLSQKRLAEMAGIQRRQLATLESGGNVTLATVRKVIAQLPNLQTFMLDGVSVEVTSAPRLPTDDQLNEAMRIISGAVERLATMIKEGSLPAPYDVAMFRQTNAVPKESAAVRKLKMEERKAASAAKDAAAGGGRQ